MSNPMINISELHKMVKNLTPSKRQLYIGNDEKNSNNINSQNKNIADSNVQNNGNNSNNLSLCFYKTNNIHAFNMIFMPIKFDHIYYFNNYEIMVKSFARNMIIFDFVDLSHAYILANIPKFLRILPNDLNRNKKNQLPYIHLIDEKGNFKDPDLENKYLLKNGHLNLQHLFVSNQINNANKYLNQDGYYFTFDQKKGNFNCFNNRIKHDDNISNIHYFFHGYNYNMF
ncbi:hypothetical protein, partial [Plasmodium yoelii yoelii]